MLPALRALTGGRLGHRVEAEATPVPEITFDDLVAAHAFPLDISSGFSSEEVRDSSVVDTKLTELASLRSAIGYRSRVSVEHDEEFGNVVRLHLEWGIGRHIQRESHTVLKLSALSSTDLPLNQVKLDAALAILQEKQVLLQQDFTGERPLYISPHYTARHEAEAAFDFPSVLPVHGENAHTIDAFCPLFMSDGELVGIDQAAIRTMRLADRRRLYGGAVEISPAEGDSVNTAWVTSDGMSYPILYGRYFDNTMPLTSEDLHTALRYYQRAGVITPDESDDIYIQLVTIFSSDEAPDDDSPKSLYERTVSPLDLTKLTKVGDTTPLYINLPVELETGISGDTNQIEYQVKHYYDGKNRIHYYVVPLPNLAPGDIGGVQIDESMLLAYIGAMGQFVEGHKDRLMDYYRQDSGGMSLVSIINNGNPSPYFVRDPDKGHMMLIIPYSEAQLATIRLIRDTRGNLVGERLLKGALDQVFYECIVEMYDKIIQ